MLDLYRQIFPEWSPRTIARYARAMRGLDLMGYSPEQRSEVLRSARRPNDTISVLKLDRVIEYRIGMWLLDNGWRLDDGVETVSEAAADNVGEK
jgi:hypothetical protein